MKFRHPHVFPGITVGAAFYRQTLTCLNCGEMLGDHAGWECPEQRPAPVPNDGSTASYYVLPEGATELQDLIAYRNLNAQMGEIFRAVYRYGQGHHSPRERDLKKIIFYAQAELDRLARYES